MKDRKGEENINNFGSRMIIFEYRRYDDIDVMFPEYNNYIVKHKQYTHFKRGSIACPLEKRNKISRNKVNGDLIVWKENNINYYNLNKLKKYLIDNPDKCSSKIEFCKRLNVYENFLDKVEEIENIKFTYNFYIKCKNDIRYKDIYQNYDWCYRKYIIEGLNHEEMAKQANCTKRVIEKWCCDKHRLTQKYRQENKKLTNKQKDLIIGSLLGDGHIDRRENQPMFIVSHAENQKDYLFWKYNILKDFCNIPPVYYECSKKEFNGKLYNCQPYYRICTRIQDCLKELRNMSYIELIDNLNWLSLCIYILDDGYRGDSNWELCVAKLNMEERNYFINVMKSKFELDAYIINYDNRYIKFRANSSRIIDNNMLDIFPNNMDIIQYKIVNKHVKGGNQNE